MKYMLIISALIVVTIIVSLSVYLDTYENHEIIVRNCNLTTQTVTFYDCHLKSEEVVNYNKHLFKVPLEDLYVMLINHVPPTYVFKYKNGVYY